MHRILVINPGSTSTKIAVFENERAVAEEVVRHEAGELSKFERLWDQFEFRRDAALAAVEKMGYAPKDFSAVVGRGGLLKPVPGGTYRINERLLDDARRSVQGQHVANLGAALAESMARQAGAQAFIVDPVSVDEFEPSARYSGHPAIVRRSLSHALNIHAVARKVAQRLGKTYEECQLIVAHLGGGISVCPVMTRPAAARFQPSGRAACRSRISSRSAFPVNRLKPTCGAW